MPNIPEHLTPAEIEAWKRAQKATLGPYYATDGNGGELTTILASHDTIYGPALADFSGDWVLDDWGGERTLEEIDVDVRYVTAACNLLPAALEEISRLRGALKEIEAVLLERPAIGYKKAKFWAASEEAILIAREALEENKSNAKQ